MNAIETFEHSGCTVNIHQDQDAESPDGFGDDALFLVAFSDRHFSLTREGFTDVRR